MIDYCRNMAVQSWIILLLCVSPDVVMHQNDHIEDLGLNNPKFFNWYKNQICKKISFLFIFSGLGLMTSWGHIQKKRIVP